MQLGKHDNNSATALVGDPTGMEDEHAVCWHLSEVQGTSVAPGQGCRYLLREAADQR